jgi:propionyl-CoA carboxylase alpha chain
VPVLPTYTDPAKVPDFPVLIKPDCGSGGAGMRVVRDATTLAEAVASTRREAGCDVYCEPYVEDVPAHRDPDPRRRARFGRAVRRAGVLGAAPLPADHRGDPVPGGDPGLREELCRAAIVAVRPIGYVGPARSEFLLDPRGRLLVPGATPTLQAEHAVTECVSGYDLVRLQLLVAEGGCLPMPGPPPIRGTRHRGAHLRRGTRRTPGCPPPAPCTVSPCPTWPPAFRPLPPARPAPGRGVEDGSVVGVHPDPTLAKLIAWAPTRQEAARMLASALTRTQLHGVATNRDLLVAVLRHHSFRTGDLDTDFLDRRPEVFAPLLSAVDAVRISCLAAALAGAAGRPRDRAGARLPALRLAQCPVGLADRGVRRPGRPGRGRLPDEPARRAGRLVGARGRPGGARPGRARARRRCSTTTGRPVVVAAATSGWC